MLAKKEGTVGSAVFSFGEVAHSGYSVKAYSPGTSQFNQQGTVLAQDQMARMDTLYDYTLGYADRRTVNAVIVALLREVTIGSLAALELVLDKTRMPERLIPVPYEGISWKADGKGGKYPVQPGTYTGGDEVELNIATFWTAVMHEDLTKVYSTPMLEPAIDRSFQFLDFLQDMWRVVRSSGHSRLVLTLDAERVMSAAPKSVRSDDKKLKSWMESTRKEVEGVLTSLQPEDALVTYDTVDVEALQAKDVKADYTVLLGTLSGMLATSLKTPPSVLGLRIAGSQSLSNTESMIYLKIAKAVQGPVEDVMSRAMTLAVRLLGADVYVKFSFNPINLRPEDELEAYRAMHQSRTLQALSLGFITDEEAASELGTGPRASGAPPLSGTMFLDAAPAGPADADPQAPRDPQGETLKPDTQDSVGGAN
jgi:hypothetical protein